MRYAAIGLAVAVLIFLVTGGHVVFLPLFFALPLGGLAAGRGRRR